MTSIQQNPFQDLLENIIQSFLKEKIELMLREEIKKIFRCRTSGRLQYSQRILHSHLGNTPRPDPDLNVPRDRQGQFQTELFEPYQRRLEDTVIHMYKGGMSTRDIASFIEKMFGTSYSPTTMSNITGTVLEDVAAWQNRPLSKRYSVIYLDGMYVKLKRQTVASEAIYIAMGIDEDGHREILSFSIGGKESVSCLPW
ncbi:IS256 family transposase [Paenibacillus donghaensis]|uniref:Mutator family transposase n=1 Tax=Paenibacillus donghaensis TaxID=414771 RepID=A0A2Z2KBK2_9BACL|nr:transposase [Paenibacillus donghaensis]ASA20283.1 hypothetical protein B9T62_05400 [Paenibacillus donghaensis]